MNQAHREKKALIKERNAAKLIRKDLKDLSLAEYAFLEALLLNIRSGMLVVGITHFGENSLLIRKMGMMCQYHSADEFLTRKAHGKFKIR